LSIGHHEEKAFNTEFTEVAEMADKTITETISSLLRGATLEFALRMKDCSPEGERDT